ncbi:Predicted metal-binding membrane protein [Aliiroseovarius halocynthiae]|uniref:DUF2182 domain-containing protein n=1 Tax=Aliiroseovarius halocynthiae TaxID=985055 RepID=A0A545SQU1_9RHOB|nr:DUF2182 domain-containing protein [Aliiroseovarius halocynthiae]TQV67355.1 DUF2182 domain-containing protein [Aliiroseovarius halocynthiae]SMR81247.1 Predicted metal-binding membrane protein [Aliiroseovarius halocynthiae]
MPTDAGIAKPQRGFVIAVAMTVASWIFVLAGAGMGMSPWGMSVLVIPRHGGGMMMAVDWTATYAVHMVVMWWIMMLAMMLPGVLLAIRLRWTSVQCSPEFLGVYATVWFGFSVFATGLQYAFQSASWFDAMRMLSVNNALSVCLLVVAALPQGLLLLRAHRRTSGTPNERARSASNYAVRCLIYSASMMLLMFIGGLMNLVWTAGLSLWAAIQKSPNGTIIAPASALIICLLVGANIFLNSKY